MRSNNLTYVFHFSASERVQNVKNFFHSSTNNLNSRKLGAISSLFLTVLLEMLELRFQSFDE